MTLESIDNLLKIIDQESHIIIVDNKSPNGTGEKIQRMYNDTNNISVILSSENYGFARGNNIGYKFAKERYNPDFIVAMNNDVIINQKNFEQSILFAYQKKSCDIIAPNIINKENFHQNPLRKEKLGTFVVTRRILFYILVYFSLTTGIFRNKLLFFYRSRVKSDPNANRFEETILDNIVPHGSCIIFCRKYIESVDFAFLPLTFLYCEEDILYEFVNRHGFKIVYEPNISVLHIEDITTNSLYEKQIDRDKFAIKNRIKSLMVLLLFRFRIIGGKLYKKGG